MKKNDKNSLLTGIGFFVIGLFIFLNPDILVKLVSYGLGGILIALGLYKIANYYIQDKRFGIVNHHEIAFGITALVLGVVFIFLADAIALLLRLVVGIWLIIAGLGKIAKTFYTTSRDAKFVALIVVGVILIGIGLYIVLVSSLHLAIIGLFMMIYGLTDFISYFVYKEKKEEVIEETSLVNNSENNDKEIIEEVEFEEKIEDESTKDNKKKKSSKKKNN